MKNFITRILKWLAAVAMMLAFSAPAVASWSIGGSAAVPSLQSVTDVGAVTTKSIEAAPATFTAIVIDSLYIITYPSVIYTGGHFEATEVCLTYGANDYTGNAGASYTLFTNLPGSDIIVGAPSASSGPEPQNISAYFDGTQNLDITLFTLSGDKYTAVNSATNTAAYQADIISASGTIDLTIPSVYTAHGATASYTFNLSAITGSGATLWGGDGANGERTLTNRIVIETATTPANSSVACEIGSVYWDASYIYVCTSANNWKRATLNVF